MPTTAFNSKFASLSFYRNHPYMLPFVGKDYISPRHKRVLLVGESHYMPKNSIVHHDADAWYNGTPTLNSEEQGYCNTSGTREYKSGQFGKEIERCLNLICPSNGNTWEEVASINYFLRPADYTENITDLWKKSTTQAKEMDCKFSLKNFLDVTEALTPDLIIFLSHFVCVHAEGDYPKFFPKKELWDWTKSRGIEYIYVNHPSSAHWNGAMPAKYAKAHGLTSRDFFCEWLKQNWMK